MFEKHHNEVNHVDMTAHLWQEFDNYIADNSLSYEELDIPESTAEEALTVIATYGAGLARLSCYTPQGVTGVYAYYMAPIAANYLLSCVINDGEWPSHEEFDRKMASAMLDHEAYTFAELPAYPQRNERIVPSNHKSSFSIPSDLRAYAVAEDMDIGVTFRTLFKKSGSQPKQLPNAIPSPDDFELVKDKEDYV